ncbi:MAG: hypothetical protein ACT4N5_01400 [Nitrosopumilaceae archaeon]
MPEKDLNGNYNRLGGQFFTWIIGGIVESSSDQGIGKLGSILRIGAEKSFADYIGQNFGRDNKTFQR